MMILLTKLLNIFIHRTLNIGFQYGKLCFLCVTCSTFITILLLWTKIELNSNKNINVLLNNNKKSIDLYMPTTPRKVTKSLSEIMKMVPEINEDIVFFNSIPRSGSELIVLLLQWLEDLNGFKHMRLPKGNRHRLNRYDQEKLIQSMMKEVREGAVPFTFDRHVYFINFTSFGHQSPTYVNLIRDPIDKAIARYYYHQVTPTPAYSVTKPSKVSSFKSKLRYAIVRDFEKCVLSNESRCMYTNGDLYDLTIPYFCGHEERCMMLNDRWALNRAKENVERYYSVVGILEEVNKTLIVLQHRLPYFFRDVLNTFNMQLTDNSKTRSLYRPTRVLNEEVKTKLKNQLLTEYEFYEYIKQRLLNQYDIASEELNL